jgi:hypothetical protein
MEGGFLGQLTAHTTPLPNRHYNFTPLVRDRYA